MPQKLGVYWVTHIGVGRKLSESTLALSELACSQCPITAKHLPGTSQRLRLLLHPDAPPRPCRCVHHYHVLEVPNLQREYQRNRLPDWNGPSAYGSARLV